jgi:hypothetical protein
VLPFSKKPSREAGFLRSEGAEWENEKSKCLSCVVVVVCFVSCVVVGFVLGPLSLN